MSGRENYDQIKKYIEADIEQEVRFLISDFAILWNNYERYLFPDERNPGNYNYSFYRLKKELLPRVRKTKDIIFEQSLYDMKEQLLNYFNSRTIKFEYDTIKEEYQIRIKEPLFDEEKNKLSFTHGDLTKEELEKIMQLNDFNEIFLFLMLIVGRVRNNMFHGIKPIKKLNEQKELFEICNNLLTLVLKITNTLVFI